MGIHGLTLASGMDGATNSVGGFLGGTLGYNAATRLTRKIPGPGWLRGGINLVAGTLAGIKGSTLANKVTNRLPQGYKRELPLALRPYSN
ncbi:MAG: hypothetical protein LHW56_01485 [Candidatus Cloacimonetes bacterium]|nr:hypothetical protein [Candidatus Cloacimonadota bacterium]MDY0171559.1 hypothetical protein [Candidatus Cloacimonadaceae bacterium]